MHKHHVTPTYRDPTSSVTVKVSVTCHAMFHWCEWQLHGDKRDWLAWKGLCGEIPKEEIIRSLRRLGGQRAAAKANKGPLTDNQKAANLRNLKLATEAARQPEAISKRIATLKERGHMQGEKNSQFGVPKTLEQKRHLGLKFQKFSRVVVSTPDGTKVLTGWKYDMAVELGIPLSSFQALIRKGKLESRGLKLESIA